MLQYLLGVLPQQWQARFEEKLFTEQQCLERLRVVEDKLVDDYVSEVLSTADRERFEKYYLTSERRRRKVELALALKKSLADLSVQAEATHQTSALPQTNWQKLRQGLASFTLQTHTRVRIVVLMLVLLLIGGGICLLAVFLRLPRASNGVSIAQVEPSVPNISLVHTPDTASPSPSISPKSSPPTQPQQREDMMTVKLEPDSLRDGGNKLKNLVVRGKKSQFIRLKLSLPNRTEYLSWRLIVTTAEGAEVIRTVGSIEKDQQSYVMADLPIRKFPIGDYIITLQGKTASGSFSDVEDYTFRLTDR